MTETPIDAPAPAESFWERVRTALQERRTAFRSEAKAVAAEPLPRVADAAPLALEGRGRLQDALWAAWEHCEAKKVSLSLLIVEIDGFKTYKADYGPLRAETCRAGVEAAIRYAMPRASSFLGRHGVGRFVIVAPDCPILLARAAATRICAEVLAGAETFTGSALGFLSVSVGVATANPRGERFAELLDGAERALLKAHDRGQGRVEAIDMRGDQPGRVAVAE